MRGAALGLEVLARELSCVVPGPVTEQAARRLLEMPDPSATLGRIYPFLVWQRTLRIALGHLESVGADLTALQIPIEAFRSSFPPNYPVVWKLDREPPVTALDMVELFERHRRLLAVPVEVLADAGLERFVLVSGRAYEARYPNYEHRVEFDTDLVAPDIAAGLDVVETLTANGYRFDSLRIRRLGGDADATFEIRRWVGTHLVSVGVLVGGYHAHRGPIADRSESLQFHGRLVRTAGPEDLLVMLAARVERKASFALVNFNDAAVILATDGTRLDWDVVERAASGSGTKATLAVLLGRAQQLLGRTEVPSDVWARLTGGARVTRAVTQRAALATSTLDWDRPRSVDTLAQRLWLLAARFRQLRRADRQSFSSKAINRVQRRILQRQTRQVLSGRPPSLRSRFVTRLRTRTGALCEVDSRLAGLERCVSAYGGWKGSPRARVALHEVAERLPLQSGEHKCGRLSFDLWARDAT